MDLYFAIAPARSPAASSVFASAYSFSTRESLAFDSDCATSVPKPGSSRAVNKTQADRSAMYIIITSEAEAMTRSRVAAAIALATLPMIRILSLPQTAELELTDIAAKAGIRAEMRCGGPEKRWIPEANGSGAAWLDYDNDGLMDLLIVNGSSMDQLRNIVAGQ